MKKVIFSIAIFFIAFSVSAQDALLVGKSYFVASSINFSGSPTANTYFGWNAHYTKIIQFQDDGMYKCQDIDPLSLEITSKAYTVDEYEITKSWGESMIKMQGTNYLIIPIATGSYALIPDNGYGAYDTMSPRLYFISKEDRDKFTPMKWDSLK